MLLAGFPLNQQNLIIQTGVATGFYIQQSTPQPPPKKVLRIMLSLVSNPGNSGGPVLDGHGEVIALLEGNLLSPLVDPVTDEPYVCNRVKLNQDGTPALDADGNPIATGKSTWCLQNSGISLAIPARSIAELAKEHNINLD
jgi:S1-C subfamily serine protease